jgi:hypothetical protein
MQQSNKDPKLKEATSSEEGEGIWHDLQGDPRAGDRKDNSRILRQDAKNEYQDIIEGLAPPKRKKKPLTTEYEPEM